MPYDLRAILDLFLHTPEAVKFVKEIFEDGTTQPELSPQARKAQGEAIRRVLHENFLQTESFKWIAWRHSLPGAASPELDEITALGWLERLAQSPKIKALLSKPASLAAPMAERVAALQADFGMPVSTIVCCHLNALSQTLGLLKMPAEVQLAHLIHYRDGLVYLGASAGVVQAMNIELGRLAYAYRDAW